MNNDRNDISTWRCPYCDALNDKNDMVCQVCGDGRREDVYAPKPEHKPSSEERNDSGQGQQPAGTAATTSPAASSQAASSQTASSPTTASPSAASPTAASKPSDAPRAAAKSERYEAPAPAKPKKKLRAGLLALLIIPAIINIVGYMNSSNEKPVSQAVVTDGRSDSVRQTDRYIKIRSESEDSGFTAHEEGQPETVKETMSWETAAGDGGAASQDAALADSTPEDAAPKVYTDIGVIWEVQNALNAASYNCGTPDGIAGQKTKNAITQYKTEMGLDDISPDITDDLLESLGIEMSEDDIKYHPANLQAAMSSLWYCWDESRNILLSYFTNKDATYGGFFYQKFISDDSVSLSWMVGPIALTNDQVVMEEDGNSITFKYDNGNIYIQDNQEAIDDDVADLILTPHNTDLDREQIITMLKAWVDFENGE